MSLLVQKKTTYIVERISTTPCDCNYRCVVCNICIHTFVCTCLTNFINFTICKHIYAFAKALVIEITTHEIANDDQQKTHETVNDI